MHCGRHANDESHAIGSLKPAPRCNRAATAQKITPEIREARAGNSRNVQAVFSTGGANIDSISRRVW